MSEPHLSAEEAIKAIPISESTALLEAQAYLAFEDPSKAIETLQAYPNADVKVFNRYGEMVFDNYGSNQSWDGNFKGRLVSPGAYVYIIDLKNNSPVLKGVVFIIL